MNTDVKQLGDEPAESFEFPAPIVKDKEEIAGDLNLLIDKHNPLIDAFETMKVNYEQEINEHQDAIKEKNKAIAENEKKETFIQQLKEDKKLLEQELESSEKNWKG